MRSPASDISVECGGGVYRGSFQMAGGMVHIASPYGETSARLGGLLGSAEILAELMLYGLAQGWTRRGQRTAEAKSA